MLIPEQYKFHLHQSYELINVVTQFNESLSVHIFRVIRYIVKPNSRCVQLMKLPLASLRTLQEFVHLETNQY